MKLYMLTFSRTKQGRKETLMIDALKKCEAYKKAREETKHSAAGKGFHQIEEAPEGSKTFRKKSATIGGYKDIGGSKNGYISKDGFNPHT